MENQEIILEKRTIDDLVNRNALHFQMETPSDSIYSTSPLAEQLSQSFLANLGFYGDMTDAEKLARVMPMLIRELVQNAIEHGNKLDSSKMIDGYFLWEEHNSGNAVMYLAVKDEGPGFDVNRYRLKNPKWGGEAIPWLKEETDHVYSIGSAVYAAKVMKRANAGQIKVKKAA